MRKVIEVRNLYKLYRVGDEFVRTGWCGFLRYMKESFVQLSEHPVPVNPTLLNMLAGLEKPTKGEVIIAGKHIEKLNERTIGDIPAGSCGIHLFQSFHLMGTLDAVENVALPLSFRGVPKRCKEYEKPMRC